MEQNEKTGKDKPPWKLIIWVVVIICIIHYSGLGEVEYKGYPIEQYISGASWLVLLFILAKKVLDKIL